MQSTELEGFEEQMAQLCAAFEVPLTKARKDAYWRGLRKMSLAQFIRCVEVAIGEDGPEDFPGTKGIWKIYRDLRAPGAPGVQTSAAVMSDPDHLEYFANRLLWLHASHRGGFGSTPGTPSPELQACLNFKRELVAEFAGFVREGDDDATPAAFVQYWLSGMRRISTVDPRTIRALTAFAEDPEESKPFGRQMARELEPYQPELA